MSRVRQASAGRWVCVPLPRALRPSIYLHYSSPYCSDECLNYDTTTTSPSISSASSVYSSPHLGYALGGEVPPLLPSELGYALKGHSRDRKSISSSSASSTAWS